MGAVLSSDITRWHVRTRQDEVQNPGVAVRVEVIDRDWQTLRRILFYLVPLVAFVVVLGAANFGWGLVATAVVALGMGWTVLVLIQRAGMSRSRSPGTSYVISASIARQTGRLRLDQSGLTWWAYTRRGGDPDFTVPWSSVDQVTIQPVAAFVPICRLRVRADGSPDDGFLLSLGVRTVNDLLSEVLAS